MCLRMCVCRERVGAHTFTRAAHYLFAHPPTPHSPHAHNKGCQHSLSFTAAAAAPTSGLRAGGPTARLPAPLLLELLCVVYHVTVRAPVVNSATGADRSCQRIENKRIINERRTKSRKRRERQRRRGRGVGGSAAAPMCAGVCLCQRTLSPLPLYYLDRRPLLLPLT